MTRLHSTVIPTLHRQPRILLAGGRRRAPLVPEMGHRARQKPTRPLPLVAGGLTNTCYNALDRHVDEGRGNELAVIFDSPVTGTKERYTYREFRDIVAQFAGALQSRGVRKGDRVIIYMPMIPEAVVAMLACARIGAIHSVVFGGFASHELAVRIDDCKPKVIISASCGIEHGKVVDYKRLLDFAIEMAHFKPEICIIRQREQLKAELNEERDLSWKQSLLGAEPAQCAPPGSNRSPLHSLHLRHHWPAERDCPRQRRAHGCPEMEHGQCLQCPARRGLLGSKRCGLGCRPLLHCLCPAPSWMHHSYF